MKLSGLSGYLLLAFTSLSLLGSAAAQETGPTYIERELSYLMNIWPGDYDNQEQISFDARAQSQQELGQGRFHAFVAKLDAPSIGDNLLYIEKSIDGDLENTYEQRVYKLEADEESKAIRVKIYAVNKSQRVGGAARNPETLDTVNIKNLKLLDGCDLLLRRDETRFTGATTGACNDDEKTGFLHRTVSVSEQVYGFNDQRYLSADQTAPAGGTVTPRLMRKARWFACMVDVPKKTPMVSNHTQHYIKIHDQGGSFQFTHPDGREMDLLMRNTWSYGMQRETFFIGIFLRGVNGKLLVYSWGSPESDRIGMNPGYVRIQCDLDTPENVKLQKGLRIDS